MRHKANALSVMISVLLLATIVIAGCQRADLEPASAVDETDRAPEPATTNVAEGETTSSEERGAVAHAGDGKAVAKSGEAEASAGNGEARAGDAGAGNGRARAGNAVAGDGNLGKGSQSKGRGLPGKVKLKVGGQPGTQFTGTCTVGGEEREVSGRVPGRFVYDLDGQELECVIRKAEAADGAIEISVNARGLHREARFRGRGEEIRFVLTGWGTNFSTFSSGSGGSVSQETKITSSSSSSASSSSDTR